MLTSNERAALQFVRMRFLSDRNIFGWRSGDLYSMILPCSKEKEREIREQRKTLRRAQAALDRLLDEEVTDGE